MTMEGETMVVRNEPMLRALDWGQDAQLKVQKASDLATYTASKSVVCKEH